MMEKALKMLEVEKTYDFKVVREVGQNFCSLTVSIVTQTCLSKIGRGNRHTQVGLLHITRISLNDGKGK